MSLVTRIWWRNLLKLVTLPLHRRRRCLHAVGQSSALKKRFFGKNVFWIWKKPFLLPFLRGRENGLWRLPDSMEQISPSRTVRGFRGFAVNAVVFVRIAQPSRSRITLIYGWNTMIKKFSRTSFGWETSSVRYREGVGEWRPALPLSLKDVVSRRCGKERSEKLEYHVFSKSRVVIPHVLKTTCSQTTCF